MAKPGSGKRKMTATWKKQHKGGDKLAKDISKLIDKLLKMIFK